MAHRSRRTGREQDAPWRTCRIALIVLAMTPIPPAVLICEACGADFPEGARDSLRRDESNDLCPDRGRGLQAQIALDESAE
jgi:hypothetical protein